jgi:hypothetical protein
MRVLEQEKRVRNGSCLALRDFLPLQLKRRRIVHKPELFEVEEHGKKVPGKLRIMNSELSKSAATHIS